MALLAGCGTDPFESSPEAVASVAQVLDTRLTCNVPFNDAPPATLNAGLIASQVTSVVGLSDTMGGIGVKLELVNNQYPTQYVNVVESRSAAGAGWQTSYIVGDWPGGVNPIVFNQAAGNSLGGQWGYTNSYAATASAIHALDWNPLVSDHLMGALPPITFSPCSGTGYVFDDGQAHITGTLLGTSAGSVIQWTHAYSLRARMAQTWPWVRAEQALYLQKSVAAMGDLRIYLKKGSTVHGPIRPVNRFTIPDADCNPNYPGSGCNAFGYNYAILVWNIFGTDVGILIRNLEAGISLNMEETTYCQDATDLTCGNINFHVWSDLQSQNISAGMVRTVSQDYVIGTLPQLAAMGYTIY
ncbi:hypothetical protein D7W81_40325 [Corallococcus aberystwythensis]|uniref:Uncharacterized protein n=2 Tax=Corallococcus aberystwythensis TaxID=2316722 RepID=A0A3A8P8Q1_9BACT|nr:hypothetical protein D7W81_40325 [Corallococcus aberystwythensis]